MSDILSSWIDNQTYWRPEFADDNEHPQKIDDAPEGGTYQSDPYLLFVEAEDGIIHLISDGTLDLIVTPVDSSGDTGKTSFKIAPSRPGDAENWADARIDIYTEDKKLQFRVRGTGKSCELQTGRYVWMKLRTDERAEKAQVLDDYFAHTGEQFYNVQTGYDVTKLIPENPGAHHNLNLFDLPPGATRKYSVWGGHVIPFGWRYSGDSRSFGETKKTVISNAAELSESTRNTFGLKSSHDIFGINIGQSTSTTEASQLQLMQERELTLITATNTLTSHAAVLDKSNVKLSDVFYEALVNLQDDIAKNVPLDASFKTFIGIVGTHYSNAATFGSKVYLVATATNEQIAEIHNLGIDIKEGLDVGASESGELLGFKIALSGGEETATEKSNEHVTKLMSAAGLDKNNFKAIGGHSGAEATASSLVPVMLDLRPISDLLAPPFFNDWTIIGLHPESLRSRLAAYIQSYAYYKIDAQGKPVPRLHRITYKSNRVTQCKEWPVEGYPPVDSTDDLTMGGVLSVKDTALFDFSLFAGSQQLKEVFRLHDSVLVTADQVTMTVEVPISQYPTVLGIPLPSYNPQPYSLDPALFNQGYRPDIEMQYYLKTGKAKPYSFTIQTNINPPEVEKMLPWFYYGRAPHLGGWATFTRTPVEAVEALGLA